MQEHDNPNWVHDFAASLKTTIEEMLQNNNVELGDRRIIVTIDADEIKVKTMTRLPKKPKQKRIPSETIKRIEEAKQILKGRRDLIYVVTLLINLANELKKLHAEDLPDNSKQVLLSAATEVKQSLSTITKEVR